MKICSEEGCDKKYSAKGFCRYHYEVLRRSRMTSGEWAKDQRKYELKYRHNLTFPQVQLLWEAQDRRCACCSKPGPDVFNYSREWPIDHDPSCCPKNKSCSDCRRGIVCWDCNLYALSSHMTLETWKSVGKYLGFMEGWE